MREIQEEFRTKKIEINANLSGDVKDLLKCVLRRNPKERLNIKQVLNHPAILNRMDEFNKPISEEQFSLLITAYMQNCGMSNKRDHPEEIKKYKASHKDFENEWFGKASEASAGFFDDVPLQFPPTNFYGPIPTPFFGSDPGFFDNIPENLSFKKSRLESQRTELPKIVINPPRSGSSQPMSGNKTQEPLAPLPLENLKRSESFNDPNSYSSRNITYQTNEATINVPSSRNLLISQASSQPNSYRTINIAKANNSAQTIRTETKEDPPSVVSIKKIAGEIKPINIDVLKQSLTFQPEPNQQSQPQYQKSHQTPVYTPADRNNVFQVSKFETMTKNQFESTPYSGITFQNATPGQPYKSGLKLDANSFQPSQNQGKTVSMPATPPNSSKPNQPTGFPAKRSDDPAPIMFVNYLQGPIVGSVSQNHNVQYKNQADQNQLQIQYGKDIFYPKNGSTQNETPQEEVRYFPYEIQEGNKSAVLNNLTEEFKRQEEKQIALKSNISNQLSPNIEIKSGVKTITLDTRGALPGTLSNNNTQQPSGALSKAINQAVTYQKTGNYVSSNVTFVNHGNSAPHTVTANPQNRNLGFPGSTDDRKYSYGKEITSTPQTTTYTYTTPSIYTNQNNDLGQKTPNVKYVESSGSKGYTVTNYMTPASYSSPVNEIKTVNYSSNDPYGGLGGVRTASFVKTSTRPGSIEKKREFSADQGKTFSRPIITTFQK